MSDEESGGIGKKAGLAGLLAGLAGIGGLADDCGRAAMVGRAASGPASLGDAAARAARLGGGLGDDAARFGAGMGDDVARGGRLPAGLGAAQEVRVGEGALARVVDDAAPGAGRSVEEALLEAGADLTSAVVAWDAPAPRVDAEAAASAPAAAVIVGAAVSRAELDARATAGALLVVVGEEAADGTFDLSGERVTDVQAHGRCAERGARCVVLTCAPDAAPACAALGAGMGRKALARTSPGRAPAARYADVVYALLEERARLGRRDLTVSRAAGAGDQVVRSKLGARAIQRAPR